jgi:hypothetical protein
LERSRTLRDMSLVLRDCVKLESERAKEIFAVAKEQIEFIRRYLLEFPPPHKPSVKP